MTERVFFQGKEFEVKLPSGKVVVYREPNGDDEEILSNLSLADQGSNITHFINSLLVVDKSTGKKPLLEELLTWPAGDKYYLLLCQRITSHGEILTSKNTCQTSTCKKEFDIEQDLREFIHEELKPTGLSLEGVNISDRYKPAISKHSPDAEGRINFTSSRGSKLRFKVLDSVLEKKQLAVTEATQTKNLKLSIRELEILLGGEWTLVTYFGMFPVKELSEIRKFIQEADPEFNPKVEFECPHCKTPYLVPLFGMPAFYYPEEGM